MKALVYEAVETLAIKDVPTPTAAEGEHLVRIAAAGICGSDMHAYLGHDDRRPAPLICWHAAKTAVAGLHPSMEHRALVIGGGAIGLAAALALRAMNIDQVTVVEPNDARRALLQDQCNIHAVSATKAPAPIVIDAVGFSATRSIACAQAEPGGIIVHLGLGDNDGGVDVRRLTLQDIAFVGSYTYTAQEFRETAQAMFQGRLGPLDWFETEPLEAGAQAFRDIRAGTRAAPKIILDPWR